MARRSILILSFLFIAGCGTGAPIPVYIGHVALSTDSGENPRASAKRGIALAVKRHNSKKDESARPIVVLHTRGKETDGSLQSESLRLMKINKVAAVLGGWSPAQAENLEHNLAPVVSAGGSSGKEIGKSIFLTGIAAETKGRLLATSAQKSVLPKAPRALVLVDKRHDESTIAANAFVKKLTTGAKSRFRPPMGSVEIIGYDTNAEFTKIIKRKRNEPRDLIMLAGEPAELVALRTLSDTQNTAIFFAGPEVMLMELLANAKTRDRIWLVSAWLPKIDTEENKKFISEFKKEHKREPDNFAAMAFENTQILTAAIGNCSYATPDALIKELSETKQRRVLSGKAAFDKNGTLQRTAFVVQLQYGLAKLVSRVEPKFEK